MFYIRKAWRWLTSMRTALALLFLLALAAIPGSLLPQRDLNEQNVQKFIESNGTVAEIYDKLQLFDVFSSVWFQAIFLLLAVSLIGCIIPRSIDHYKAWRTQPTRAPKYLHRLPLSAEGHSDKSEEELSAEIHKSLKKWRVAEYTPDKDRAGAHTFSAERGYGRELANLIFHVALVAILVTVAAGRLVNYEGQVIVVTESGSRGGNISLEQSAEFCNTSTSNFDSFRAGPLFDGTGLHPFCMIAHNFTAKYLPNGQAEMFTSNVSYAEGDDIYKDSSEWKDYELKVNHPLRLAHNRVYLQGHGYAPTVTVEWPNGEKRTQTIQFQPTDTTFFLSSGVLRFDPPAGMYPDLFERRQNQLAIQGLFAPTAEWSGENGKLLQSSHPGLNDPALAVDIYRGDAGLDTGTPQSLFSLDSSLVHSGQLQKIDRVNLSQGDDVTLDDGTKITFEGANEFANYQVSYDPFQKWVLASALVMLVSLVASLMIKRRRVYIRLRPDSAGGTNIEMGGLARTDRAGWSEEFNKLHRALLELPDPDEVEEDKLYTDN
ncbi:cytochrome C biogenesis protein ResB [Corynebacterium macginleyi]|uniref:Cytochrome c biogenesis protein ResB n=1 Tax=Corynebacterium macginleyi TaxID=38290 RepID=A0ABS1Y3S1_9CORY|nr:cytochrome c biogenesis protein ResB [Corynebacterium macginleyi]MBK4139212.1 cytochrome C biogenesis protein ResB [Corynebacterium macginleyi]MBK4142186.1 cytochrome C biogenesis protein ResB [Corynebacterium macginleyi]MBK4144009.1 cytochrome C biogenesis protein ResB [Corynebacterium macginleyi]MBK4147349.1 cytochrome C biogenesis protein ResB [Corynebacterium macginleyi]MBK4163460.1 cytochrome C biogenesis protein ResB [Corynebacterium macginleyi]